MIAYINMGQSFSCDIKIRMMIFDDIPIRSIPKSYAQVFGGFVCLFPFQITDIKKKKKL